KTKNHRPPGEDRRGAVLLVVLVTVVMLSLAAYQYSTWMSSEYKVSRTSLRAAQANALAQSGVHYTASLLSSPDALSSTLNGNPYNNPLFRAQGSEESGPGKFSLVAPGDPTDPSSGGQAYRFGVIDEGGKINLNSLLKWERRASRGAVFTLSFSNGQLTLQLGGLQSGQQGGRQAARH